MKAYRKTVLYSSISLLALQLTAQPIVSYAETGGSSKINISSSYVRDGAQATFSSNISSSTPGYLSHLANENISMTRVDSTQQLYYSVPKADVADGSYIDLDISYSELLLPSTSTMTISIDGRPLKSILLTKETSSRLVNRIYLGSEDVAPGFHSVTIEKHSTISNDLCDDEENPANWLKINRSSVVFLNTTTSFTTADALRSYPFPFVEQGIQDEMYGAVMVPDHPSSDVISSAMRLAAYFSSKTATKRATPVMTESEWLNKDLLLPAAALGSIDSWSGPVKQMIAESPIQVKDRQLSLDTFAVKNQASNESRQVLLVSAAADKVIKDQIHVLTEKKYVDQLAGNHLVINDQSAAPDAQDSAKPITFESMGIANIKLDKTSTSSDRLTYTIPSFWSLTGESQLLLKVRVSPLLQNEAVEVNDKNKSKNVSATTDSAGLTVVINDIPKTFAFADIMKSKKEDDSYLLPIALGPYLKSNQSNTLTMTFTAHLNEAHNVCGPKSDNGKWIFIDKSSTLQLPHEIQKETSFKNWPSPFVGDQGLDRTVFLLPKEVDGVLLSQLAAMIRDMTNGSSANASIDIVQDQEPDLEQKLKGRNVIVVGNPDSFEALNNFKDQLMMSPGSSQYPTVNSNIINETTDYAAWIQTSVWDKERIMAVFQAGESNKAKDTFMHVNLLKFLNNEQKSSQVVVMSKSNEVLSFDLKGMQTTTPATSTASASGSNRSLIWMAAAVGLVFIIGLVLFIRLLRRPK
ncbi:cellulose biosynthesis cyclic di-GMP-binding regulatory protein BcsB [Paenibacillus sp. UNC451MF]|uniref:cellulose biosynthesis cyclic di-GMP-binding regulatory protein BcsB n=1 Tax=Paenibacillus sp. UNC451MF TaxID=1449063 RepID=UPI00048C38F2|nr:cellulose biosynthesis cyclic di-GMP-binding regulatory protein BcsB [Paenibacillus sp. UNC451MF]